MARRIRTTHVGSLPRPDDVLELLLEREEGRSVDEDVFEQRVTAAVEDAVRRQREIGIDVISDGELSRTSFNTYVFDRLEGFERTASGGRRGTVVFPDLAEFPAYAKRMFSNADGRPSSKIWACRAPLKRRREPIERELARLKAAAGALTPETTFVTAVTPAQLVMNFDNEHYATDDEYWDALVEVMKAEYEAAASAGAVLQLDSPEVVINANLRLTVEGWNWRAHVERGIDALNAAVENIPASQLRYHLCWGNYVGPHHLDIELAEVLPMILRVKAQTISFEAANPRHEHEWEVFTDAKVPDDKILMPGVVDPKTPLIEHPRLVAQRLRRFADVVGNERVLAAPDCGFATAGWSLHVVDPQIAWKKLESLVQGAELASTGRTRARSAATPGQVGS